MVMDNLYNMNKDARTNEREKKKMQLYTKRNNYSIFFLFSKIVQIKTRLPTCLYPFFSLSST
jgi:hypothetical protein